MRTSCSILWLCHILTIYLALLTLCREQVTYLKSYFWSWMPTNNCQLMSLLPLKEQALGLGIRQTGLVVPHQISCDKLAVVPRVQCGIQKEWIVLWAESGVRKNTIKHMPKEAKNSILHHAIFFLLYFLQKCSAFLTDMISVIRKSRLQVLAGRQHYLEHRWKVKGKGMLMLGILSSSTGLFH